MFGCSETFHRNRGMKSRKRWWLAGYVRYDAAQMRCTTRQKDVQYVYINEDVALQA